MTSDQATAQILNWITWQMKNGEDTEIRLSDLKKENVYNVHIKKWKKGKITIEDITHEPTLVGKVLHYWGNFVTYETLSAFELKASIECADALNPGTQIRGPHVARKGVLCRPRCCLG